MFKLPFFMPGSALGIAALLVGWRFWGDSDNEPRPASNSGMRSEDTCLIINGDETPAVMAAESCSQLQQNAPTCQIGLWGAAYTLTVPYGRQGLDGLKIVHHSKTDTRAVEPKDVGMLRGTLSDKRDGVPWGTGSMQGTTWTFTESATGNVILFHPNPNKALVFNLVSEKEVAR